MPTSASPAAAALPIRILTRQFELTAYTIRENTREIDHDDSMFQPPNGTNCLNWIFGHILANQNTALNLLGEDPVSSLEDDSRYARGSEPLTDPAQAVRFERMLADFLTGRERLGPRLAALTTTELGEVASTGAPIGGGGKSLLDVLAGLAFHEAYHAGQLGILRRLIGRAGVLS